MHPPKHNSAESLVDLDARHVKIGKRALVRHIVVGGRSRSGTRRSFGLVGIRGGIDLVLVGVGLAQDFSRHLTVGNNS
jgi:hypothetical protein